MNENKRRSPDNKWSDRHPAMFWSLVALAVVTSLIGFFYIDGNVLHNVPPYTWHSLKFWH